MNTSGPWAGKFPTIAELRVLPDGSDTSHELFEYANGRLADGDKNVPEDLWIIDAVWKFHCELENGGFCQYFWNHGIEHAEWTARGLHLIGDRERADLMQKAMELFRKNEALIKSYVSSNSLQAFSDLAKVGIFRDLDRQYYNVTIPAEGHLVNYVRTHAKNFA